MNEAAGDPVPALLAGRGCTAVSALHCAAERRDGFPEMQPVLHVTQAAPSFGQRVDEQPLG